MKVEESDSTLSLVFFTIMMLILAIPVVLFCAALLGFAWRVFLWAAAT